MYAEWIARYGVREQSHSDRGTQFESAFFEELCIAFGIDKTRTSPYRPQANGKWKRFNRTLITILRRAVQKRPYDWEPLLPAVLQAYRSTSAETTGLTPSRFVFKHEMRLPVDIGTPLPEPPRNICTNANILSEDLEWAYKVAREMIKTQHKSEKTRYNNHVVEKLFKPGVYVRVFPHARNYGATSKLVPHYFGLCEVLAVRGQILTLRELDTHRELTANHGAVRLSSLTQNRLPAAVPRLPDGKYRAPSPPLDADHRAPSPTPSLTPPHSPTASPPFGNDALLAPPSLAAFQPQATTDEQLDADARPQRRRNPPPYLDDYVVSFFNERTMLSVQNFLSRIFKFLMICNLCAQVHLLFYLTYTPLHNQITTILDIRTRTQTTILQSDSLMHLMI